MAKVIQKDSLIFKNLPTHLSNVELKDFFAHFGATNVKIISAHNRQNVKALAKFPSDEVAKDVMFRLHQMEILGFRLCVEYTDEEVGSEKAELLPIKNNKEGTKNFSKLLNSLNSWNSSVSFNQPPPSYMKYDYPKPNRATINNIGHAMSSVPKFYTQVLHLMNIMNLPPPFSNVPDPPDHHPRPLLAQQSSLTLTHENQKSSSESELESDPDNQKTTDIIPMKRTKPQKKLIKRPKLFKNPTTINSVSGKTIQSTDEVFEKVNLQNSKNIEVNVTENFITQIIKNNCGDVDDIIMNNSYGTSTNGEEICEETTTKNDIIRNKVITEKELFSNKILSRDYNLFPVFKDYHVGAPSSRLYIKNLAKNVEMHDLEFIYKRYKTQVNNDEEKIFDIRLLQEGRMKGQAFVTLESIEQAQKAVKETNGYLLKNKPMVVVFAKSLPVKTKK